MTNFVLCIHVQIRFASTEKNYSHRLACILLLYFSVDELLVTELLFNGVFNQLTPEQSCALVSCFVFQERSQEMPKLTEELSGPLRQMQVCFGRKIECMSVLPLF